MLSSLSKIQFTTMRAGIYYCQFWCGKQLIKFTLQTDSYRQAANIMSRLRPCIDNFKAGLIDKQELLSVAQGNCMLLPTNPNYTDKAMSETANQAPAIEGLPVTKPMNLDPAARQEYLQHLLNDIAIFNQTLGFEAFTFDGKSVTYTAENETKTIPVDFINPNFCGELLGIVMVKQTQKLVDHKLSEIHDRTHAAIDHFSRLVADGTSTIEEFEEQARKIRQEQNIFAARYMHRSMDALEDHLNNLASLPPEIKKHVMQEVRSILMARTLPGEAAAAALTFDLSKANAIAELSKPKQSPIQFERPDPNKKKPVLLSELYELHSTEKQATYLISNKPKTELTPAQKKTLQRQQKYFMKFKAVAGDYNIYDIKRKAIFAALIKLFDWPDENADSIYNTKLKVNKDKAQTPEWYSDIAASLDDLAEDETIKKSAGTVQEIFGWLQELYKYAVDDTDDFQLDRSPVSSKTKLYLMAEENAKRNRSAFTPSEITKIIDHVVSTNHKLKWIVLFMCHTGVRNSELFLIKKEDINLEAKVIYINGTKTEAAKRYIPLSDKLIEYGLKDLLANKAPSDCVVKGLIHPTKVNTEFLSILADVGIPEVIETGYRTFYSIRSTVRSMATPHAQSDLIEIFIGHKISGTAQKIAYFDAKVIMEQMEPFRPIVDRLPW